MIGNKIYEQNVDEVKIVKVFNTISLQLIDKNKDITFNLHEIAISELVIIRDTIDKFLTRSLNSNEREAQSNQYSD